MSHASKQVTKPLTQKSQRTVLGNAYRLDTAKKTELLRRILDGDALEAFSKGSSLVLMGNLLDKLILEHPDRKALYTELYRTSSHVKRLLLRTLEEFDNPWINRKSFGPGMFTGLQGRLNCVILTRYVLEEKLGMSFAEVMQEASFRLLYKYHLRCAKVCFRHLADLIIASYPEREVKPYYFKNYRGMWYRKDGSFNDELATEAIREFLDTIIRADRANKRKLKTLPRWLTFRMFQRRILPFNRSLSYLLNIRFKNSHIQAATFAYPEMDLQPYYFKHVPRGYWQGREGKDNAVKVVTEFVDILSDPEGKYQFSRDEAVDLVTFNTLQKPVLPHRKRLGGMLRVVFGNSAPQVREEILKQ